MGGTSSKGVVFSQNPDGTGGGKRMPGPVIPQEPPYPGPNAQYTFVNLDVTMTQQVGYSFTRMSMMTSNVDAYYPLLAQQMDQGFKLLTFYHIPGQAQRTGGLFSMGVNVPYQGIFCRYPTAPDPGRYQLRIEKSVIQPQMVWNGFITRAHNDVVTDTSHLFQTIANLTSTGARLICIELTGHETTERSISLRQPYATQLKGVDLFFEIPLQPNPEIYHYNIACVPIVVTLSAGSFNPKPVVHCDWLGVLAQHLSQGYRLVEIFMDETSSTQYAGFSSQQQLNSQWFFEKPASRINDPTPMYQGTVVEHLVSMSAGFSGTRAVANWEPVMQDMGNKGWELACILETPEVVTRGIGSVTMKTLLFFQRRLF